MTRTELTDGNTWEQALHRHLRAQVDEDRDLLVSYQLAARDSQSAAFRYLVSVIVEDEARHRVVFDDLAKTLQTEVGHGREEFAIPRLGQWGFERERVLAMTEVLMAKERQEAKRLRDLEAELDPVKDTTMWPLLIRLMQADASKHMSILMFIKEQVERTWSESEGDWEGIEHAIAGRGRTAERVRTLPCRSQSDT